MNTKFNINRRGMTLAGLLIVIAVLGILATMMMLSSSEAIATAKAAQIVANLQMFKRAVVAWYVDNNDRVVKYDMQDGNGNAIAGMVLVNNNPKPIQQCSENDLQLNKYLGNVKMENFNIHYDTKSDANTGNQNTNLKEGCYGICDGGTVKTPNGVDDKGNITYATTEYHRSAWYVGYRFTDNEGPVRDKIRGRMKSLGVFFGTPDAHVDEKNDTNAAVWLRVL